MEEVITIIAIKCIDCKSTVDLDVTIMLSINIFFDSKEDLCNGFEQIKLKKKKIIFGRDYRLPYHTRVKVTCDKLLFFYLRKKDCFTWGAP